MPVQDFISIWLAKPFLQPFMTQHDTHQNGLEDLRDTFSAFSLRQATQEVEDLPAVTLFINY